MALVSPHRTLRKRGINGSFCGEYIDLTGGTRIDGEPLLPEDAGLGHLGLIFGLPVLIAGLLGLIAGLLGPIAGLPVPIAGLLVPIAGLLVPIAGLLVLILQRRLVSICTSAALDMLG